MLTVTENAAKNLKELMAEKSPEGAEYDQETVGLRVFVQGGGCSGFQYGLRIENEPQENDQKFESNGIRIYVDPISIRYLKGAEVDFKETTANPGGGFTINNPNAVSTCGCGQSFNTG